MDSSEMDKGCDDKGLRHREGLGRHRQRGSVLVLVTVGMLAIIGMAGLALQSGHLFVDKTQVQNALDAAALSAAKTLSNGGTVAQAGAAGQLALEKYKGNSTFLEREVRDASYTLAFQFSATLDPFTPGATEISVPPATFVRARATDFTMNTWLANVLPGVGAQQDIGGTAVAGPVPIDPNNICDLVPLVMCAKDPASPDTDCSDGKCFGYNPPPNGEVCLKNSSQDVNGCPTAQVGAGEFHLLDFGQGGAGVRENLAGGYAGCVGVGQTVPTKSGNNVGPVYQGLNTRFGIGDSAQYPSDTVTYSQPQGANQTCTFCYDDYESRQHAQQYDPPHAPRPQGDGVPERRRVAVTIGRCPAANGGVQVLGIGCLFLTRPVSHQGNTQVLFGQLVGECEVGGRTATAPPAGTLPYKIVLYKDPDSRDS